MKSLIHTAQTYQRIGIIQAFRNHKQQLCGNIKEYIPRGRTRYERRAVDVAHYGYFCINLDFEMGRYNTPASLGSHANLCQI